MRIRFLTVLCALVGAISPLLADHHEAEEAAAPSLSPTEQTANAFVPSFLGYYELSTGKVLSLAEAFPAETMDWSPMEGVFTVEGAILHMAAANYFLARQLGAPTPEGIQPAKLAETVKGKEAVIQTLSDSIDFVKKAALEFPQDELGDPITLFGQEMTKMSVFFIIIGHAEEHLGQLIAYARSNEIVPPWSRAE
jgi:uncharacterized damage-inducible protein DinB